MLLHITLTVPESKDTWLAAFNVWLDPLRLPLFFLVSGFFAQKVFRFSFAELFTLRLFPGCHCCIHLRHRGTV
nr:hypothetical protein [Corynebacterium sp. HMSC062A03]